MRPISAFVSPARSSPASSMSAIVSRRRFRGATRSRGSGAAGRKRRGGACGGDLEFSAGGCRSRALYDAQDNGWASVADFDRKKAANDEAQGRLERARRSLDLARNQLGYADLKADADGVITATLAEPGQVVAIGQPVARLAHRGEKEAVVALPETWLAEARKSKATVRLVGGPRPQLRRRSCASSRRRPTPRPAPMRRASPSRMRTTPSRSA